MYKVGDLIRVTEEVIILKPLQPPIGGGVAIEPGSVDVTYEAKIIMVRDNTLRVNITNWESNPERVDEVRVVNLNKHKVDIINAINA
jgi:hypothetical protein